MTLTETSNQSFIVRFWLEEDDKVTSKIWRGHAIHIPTQDDFYFQDLNELIAYIKQILTAYE